MLGNDTIGDVTARRRGAERLSFVLLLCAALVCPSRAMGQAGSPFLGVRMEQAGAAVRVTSVLPGSGAARAGIQPGDHLVTVRGTAVSTPDEVATAVGSARVGDRIPVVVSRDGATRSLTVELGPRPPRGGAIQAFVGRQAPEVRLAEATGRSPVDLSALRGRVAMVYFWSVWCGACRTAMPTLDRWERTLGPRGLTIIGVTDDPAVAVRSQLTRAPTPYAVGLDVGSKVGSAYWVEALPTFFLVDRSGIVAHVVEGWDPSQSGALEAEILRLLGPATSP